MIEIIKPLYWNQKVPEVHFKQDGNLRILSGLQAMFWWKYIGPDEWEGIEDMIDLTAKIYEEINYV